jgi:excisionase family DNA binding protein
LGTEPPTNDILTTGEAAALCGVSRSTLRRAVSQGQLTAWHTPGKHLRFSRAACVEFARRLGRADVVDVVGRVHGAAPQVGFRSVADELEALHHR